MKSQKVKIILTVVAAALLLLAAGVSSGAIPRGIGTWLDTGLPPVKADLIYVFAGGPTERPAYAAELYEKEYAPRLVVAGILVPVSLQAAGLQLNEGTLGRMELEDYGVPRGDIIQLDAGTSTLEELEALRDYMDEEGLDSALLVTSPFHTRRVRMCVHMVFSGSRSNITVTGVPEERARVSLKNWWASEYDTVTVAMEYIKLTYYLFKHRPYF